MIAVHQTPQPRALPLPASPDVVRRLRAMGWSCAQIREHVELAMQLGLDPLSLCPHVHARVFDS